MNPAIRDAVAEMLGLVWMRYRSEHVRRAAAEAVLRTAYPLIAAEIRAEGHKPHSPMEFLGPAYDVGYGDGFEDAANTVEALLDEGEARDA